MRRVVFHTQAFADFTAWAHQDPTLFERITRLITETSRDPFRGIGKPEPLRHQLKGFWSRRINDEAPAGLSSHRGVADHRILSLPLLSLTGSGVLGNPPCAPVEMRAVRGDGAGLL